MHRIHVRASVQDVWRAITDPTFSEQYYFGLSVHSEWKVGARIVYEMADGKHHMVGTIIEIDPPERLRFSARVLRDADTAADRPSRITWELVATGDGCDVTVVHDEFESETPTYRSVSGGWPVALRGLKELLETGQAVRAQATWPEHLARPPRFGAN